MNTDDFFDYPIWDNEMENSSSRFCIEKYEILFSSSPSKDDDGFTDYTVQYINGADVKSPETDLQYEINWKEKGKSINSVSFTMPSDEAKLGNIFSTSPYGLIKKNRTGIGATTLELESPRNSIVVVPTKALAITKAKKSKIEGTEKYKYLYVAGDSSNLGFPYIGDYLSDNDIIYKKFIVVADSLPKVLREIEEPNYPLYFLMVDEIDSYQYDSSYRDSLENVIDYYFKFPESKRCLVSATVGEFSNEKIKKEPVINVNFNESLPRNIDLLHTNNIITTAVKQIVDIRREYPDDKIMIAYNSVRRGIKQIIECLIEKYKELYVEFSNEQIEELLKNECAVLCSKNSKRYIEDYYSDIEGEQLPKKINFITCSYFVGIDISERFHLISIADSTIPFTLLSEDKFIQIAGRCRDDEGLYRETIIYQSRQMDSDRAFGVIRDSELEDKIKDDAFLLAKYANTLTEIAETFPLLQIEQSKVEFDNIIVKSSKKGYYGTTEIKLVRKDIDGIIQPAYLNIDNIIIQHNLLNNLYFSIDKLHQSLEQSGNYITFQNIIEENTERVSKKIQTRINSDIREAEENEINEIIAQLRLASSLEERMELAGRLKWHSDLTSNGQLFVDRFLELQKYVPFEQLISKLPEHQYDNEYNKFYDSVIFWALADSHPFKIAFYESFPLTTPVKKVYITSEQIAERINNLLMSTLGIKELSKYQAVQYLDFFCSKNRVKHRELGNPYIIRNYDVNNFNTIPLNTISADIEIHKEFRFLKKQRNVLTFPIK